jgi:hypothetical protein
MNEVYQQSLNFMADYRVKGQIITLNHLAIYDYVLIF